MSFNWLAAWLLVAPAALAQAPQHKPDFDAERARANELFLAGKMLEALPLYTDLAQQDSTVAVFAERHAAGLLAEEATLKDPAAQAKVNAEAMAELRRAQSLGDNSDYVQSVLSLQAKNPVGAIIEGIPLTAGYTHQGKPEALPAMKEAEAAFGHSDFANAAQLYVKAAALDPAWYEAALFAGDMYFRLKDLPNAGLWFARAITIDPDRETAYRYWADALARSGDLAAAKPKYEQAYIAEPTAERPSCSWLKPKQRRHRGERCERGCD